MIGGRRAELAALIDDVAPSGWRDDRRWRELVTAAAVLEPWAGRPAPTDDVDGGPGDDALVGSPGPAAAELAGAIGWAIAAGHAAIAALAAREGQFPFQPLRVTVERRFGRWRVVPSGAPTTVGFAIGDRLVVATLDPRGPGHEQALARHLAEVARGRVTSPPPAAIGPPVAVIAIGDQPIGCARHGHRRAWTADGGPWLGVARAEGLTVLSASRLAVDGFGHTQLAGDVGGGLDRGASRALAALAATIVGDAAPPPPTALPDAAIAPLGVAWRRLPGPAAAVASQAWALGRALAGPPGGPPRARGATLRIAVAAGPPDDPTRFARRTRTALVTVRCPDGRPEPRDRFAARAGDALADAAVGRGLLDRLRRGLAGPRVPGRLERRWLGDPLAADGPGAILAGDGGVAHVRTVGRPPLVAVAGPRRLLADHAAEATAVLTVIEDERGGAIATIAGRGAAGSPAGAAALLAAWSEALADDRPATIGA